ncbi:MAG: TlpA family protein disulfide reductase, partial [Dehalococcoidia bacterium]
MAEGQATARRRPLEYAVLAGAIVAAAAVVAFFLLTGGDEDAGTGASPEATVNALYAAAASADVQALRALLVPEVQEDFSRASVAFPNTPFAPPEGTNVTFIGLQVRLISEQAGWASVAVTGEYRAAGSDLSRPIEETIYLRKDSGWRIASQSLFVRTFRTPEAATTALAGVKLGPLVPQRPKVGELAPDFALVDARDGSAVRKLSDYRGKVVIVNWYASWCGPCKEEIPDFEAASQQLKGDLVVLGVNYLESRQRAVSILDTFKATYPAVLDSEGDVADHYRVGGGLPATFFVDRDGVLQGTQLGLLTTEAL